MGRDKNQVWSEEDDQVDKMLDEDQEFNFSIEIEKDQDTPLQAGGVEAFAQDTDSVSTFRTRRKSSQNSTDDSGSKSIKGQMNNRGSEGGSTIDSTISQI
mmetsp:Transcript_11778/g.17975  ORF Transcript_11778/g.17975 Transcript_11778/m.17975 type:complete len:100 (+) Transcript_11778:331-630(+)